MKLEERDKQVLALIGTQSRSVSDIAESLNVSPADLTERLADLADNGLVYDLGDGCYKRTESGRRVLLTSTPDITDERIDTSPEIEQVIDGYGLRADEADAVRHAFTFLRYWGRVTKAEIIDAIYSEATAGRQTSEQWWNEVVREPLATLPDVKRPTTEDEPWRYTGMPEAGNLFTDGRLVLSRTHPVYGDIKHALESLDLTEAEQDAVRTAFGYLYRRGEVTERGLRETVYPKHTAGFESSQAWWEEVVSDAFEALPGVEQTSESTWRYRQT